MVLGHEYRSQNDRVDEVYRRKETFHESISRLSRRKFNLVDSFPSVTKIRKIHILRVICISLHRGIMQNVCSSRRLHGISKTLSPRRSKRRTYYKRRQNTPTRGETVCTV